MGNGKVQSVAGLVLSLLEQLCADSPDLPRSLQSLYTRDPRRRKSGLENALLGASTLQQNFAGKPAGEQPRMEQSAGATRVPSLLPPEHPIVSHSTSEQRSTEERKMGKSSPMGHQGEEGLILYQNPTLEVLLNALKDVSQEITVKTFIVVDGWDECNMDSEDEFRRLFAVLRTLRWKILIASRRPPTNADSAYCSSFHIRDTDNAEDIRAFTEKATQHTLLQKHQGFRQEAIQNITKSSQGM